MRFTVKQVGCGGERIGCLTGFAKASNAVIETPTAALLTQGGSVVHLTADVLAKVFTNPQLLWVPLSNSAQLENGLKAQGEGVAKFVGLQDHVTCATLHNINELTPSGHFEKNLIPLWTKQGKKMITADRYMDYMEAFKPDILLAIADGRTTLADGNKRNQRAVERTCTYFDTCLNRYKASTALTNTSLVATASTTTSVVSVYGSKADSCTAVNNKKGKFDTASIFNCKGKKLRWTLNAFLNATEGAMTAYMSRNSAAISIIKKIVVVLYDRLEFYDRNRDDTGNFGVVASQSSYTMNVPDPEGVVAGSGYRNKCFDCINHILKHKEHLGGIALAGMTDGTEESYKDPLQKFEEIFKSVGEAVPKDLVHFVEGCWNPEIIMVAIQHGWDVFDGTYPLKLTNAGEALALNFDLNETGEEYCILDLNDESYKEDFRPILKDCECLACKKHTRAYIRHLLNTREMLANVLLSIHNLHHFDQMFVHTRHHIATNTFDVYKNHIIQQYKLCKNIESDPDTVKLKLLEKYTEQTKKKICVSNGDAPQVVNGSS